MLISNGKTCYPWQKCGFCSILFKVSAAAAHVVQDSATHRTQTHQSITPPLPALSSQRRRKRGVWKNSEEGRTELRRGKQRQATILVTVTIQICSSRQRMLNSASVPPLLIDRWRWRFSPLTLQTDQKKKKKNTSRQRKIKSICALIES